jgi:glycine cleavage system H protein
MDVFMTILISSGVFIVGMLVRAAVLVLVLTLLALPLLVIVTGMRGLEALWQQLGAVVSVGGLPWKAGLYYAPGHLWVKRRWGTARVGLDGVAQRIVFGARAMELPQPGLKVHAGEVVGRVRCGDKHAAIASPVEGVVTAANETLSRNPSVLHRDPYREGWLFEVRPANFGYPGLRRGRSARNWFSAEAARLTQFLERDLGLAAADGGELVLATPALLNNEQWTALSESFLNPQAPASANRAEAAGTSVPSRPVALLLAVGAPVAGGLFVLFLPIIGLVALLGMCSLRLWQLLRSAEARVAARLSRPAHL